MAKLSESEIQDFATFPVGIDENGDFDTDLQPQIEFEALKNGSIQAVLRENCSIDAILNSAKLAETAELSPVNTLQVKNKLYILFCGKNALESAKKLDFFQVADIQHRKRHG